MSTPTPGPGAVVMAVHRPDPMLLKRQVASLRAQTITDWRCLVGIDGTDPQALRLLLEVTGDDRRFGIREYHDNLGVYRHFERLLGEIDPSAGWVALADQDDYWYPDKFATLLPLLAEPGVTAVTGQARVVDAAGTVLGRTERRTASMPELLIRNQVTGSLTLFHRTVLDAALPFPDATDIAMHDHWVGVCAAGAGEVRVCRIEVQDYVQHGGNALGEAQPRTLRGTLREVPGGGTLREKVRYAVREQWGWRVSMAITAQRLPLAPRDRLLSRAVANGSLTGLVARQIVHALSARHVSVVDALGLLAASALWPFLRGNQDV